MSLPFRAAIFDLDGTLLDTLDDIANASNCVLAARGFPTHLNSRYRTFVGDGVVKLMARALPEPHRDEATVQACVAEYVQEYERTWNVQTKPYVGVPEMLDGLVSRGLKLAVLSNKPDHFTQRCVGELLAKWAFDAVLGASDRFPRKPHPASAIAVAGRLGVSPAECLYLGDSGVDMQTARAAGMFAVGALWGFRDQAELLESGAELLVQKPGEVLDLLNRQGQGRLKSERV
ncbi:MAG TPA: HAD family hydrolase [Candidatus Paceibacterota bacterium]|nr:HAD family hydrolase [Verrucomicrobiota bacterium]HSA08956.1 HAD family hydrolase [Candidatus Paceibacterota bacterium]